MQNVETLKKAVKEHGVKGFRKLALKRTTYVAGRQCAYLNKHIALRLIDRVEALGFEVCQKQTAIELAEKGLLDTLTIQPKG